MAALVPGRSFPQIQLQDEKGRPGRLPAGETLYGFFKTTCPTCELAWPYLERIRKLAQGGTLSLLAVSQDDPETTAQFYARLGVEIPTLYDPKPWRASDALELTSVPTFLLVDRGGVVRDTAEGFQKHKMEEFGRRAARHTGRPFVSLYATGENVPAIKPG